MGINWASVVWTLLGAVLWYAGYRAGEKETLEHMKVVVKMASEETEAKIDALKENRPVGDKR